MKTIRRIKPRTDNARINAINKAKKRKDITPSANIPLTPSTIIKLDNSVTNFGDALKLLTKSSTVNTTASGTAKKSKMKAVMFVSHYFQSYNNGIERGVFPKASRKLHALDVNSKRVPKLFSIERLKEWGDNIRIGDAKRVAAGGVAMSNPTAAEVNDMMIQFNSDNNALTLARSAFQNDEQKVIKLRIPTDIVISKIMDEVETFVNEKPAPARRDYGKSWGIKYSSDTIVDINVKVTNSVTGSAVPEAVVLVKESKTKYSTDGDGKKVIKTSVSKKVTLLITAPNFHPAEVIVKFEKGVALYKVKVELVPLIIKNDNEE